MNDPDQFGFFEEASPEEALPFAIEVPVLKVFDGDGFRTKIALCQLTGNPKDYSEREAIIRCAFIDAPELEQRGGSEAREFLTALIGGRKVWIDIRMKMDTGKSVDQHGRIVAWDHGAAAWSRRRNRSSKGMTPVRQLHLFRGRRQRGTAPPAPTEFAPQAFLVDVIRRGLDPRWRFSVAAPARPRPANLRRHEYFKRTGAVKGLATLR